MWTNLSALAEKANLSAIADKAKEAAALIETRINDSLAEGGGEGGASPSSQSAAAEDCSGVAGGEDGDKRAPPGSDGWENCDEISSSDNSGEKIEQPEKEEKPQEMSFVAVQEIPKNDAGGLETNTTLLDALARIESLENQVNSLKDELAAAREESQNYHATNLLLEQQVKELQEENTSVKNSDENEK